MSAIIALGGSELWKPIGAHYEGNELILDIGTLSQTEYLQWLLDTHPIFTGRCPACEMPIDEPDSGVHWDCEHCGWKDDGC